MKLYIDSSIPGWSLNQGNVKRFNEANLLLKQISEGIFTGAYSWVTEEEISAAPEHILIRLQEKVKFENLKSVPTILKKQAKKIAQIYCDKKIVPCDFMADALHIAIAGLWEADALVSYNFQHIVNLKVMMEVNKINRDLNLKEIFLCQPQEVIIYDS